MKGARPLKLLILAERFRPVVGGAETVVYETSRALVARGHEVTLLYGAPVASPDSRRVDEGWREASFVYRTRDSLQRNVSTLWNVGRAFARLASGAHFDLVHVHHALPGTGLGLSRGRRLPWVYTFHGPTYAEFLVDQGAREFPGRPWRAAVHPLFLRVYAGWLKRLQRAMLEHSRRTVVLSAYMRDRAREVAPRLAAARFRVIPGGVDTERFRPAPDRAAVRRALGLPLDGPLLLTVRRLVPRMGLDRLIDAMPGVLARFPGAVLVMGGEGPLAEELRARAATCQVSAHVRFPGRIPDGDLPRFFQAADLFVLPTLTLEGFGLVLAEAMACGTPALGTATGGIPEALSPLGPEFLIPEPTAEAIADRVIAVLEKHHGDDELRRRCRAVVDERYRWERVAAQLEGLYGEVLAGAS